MVLQGIYIEWKSFIVTESMVFSERKQNHGNTMVVYFSSFFRESWYSVNKNDLDNK